MKPCRAIAVCLVVCRQVICSRGNASFGDTNGSSCCLRISSFVIILFRFRKHRTDDETQNSLLGGFCELGERGTMVQILEQVEGLRSLVSMGNRHGTTAQMPGPLILSHEHWSLEAGALSCKHLLAMPDDETWCFSWGDAGEASTYKLVENPRSSLLTLQSVDHEFKQLSRTPPVRDASPSARRDRHLRATVQTV